ncbi:MAG TPA: fibronectin type III domain-containing protein [Terriglobia bacterium]|nr:fibronectin type III domain-containing protein [Terriglobia bacterium]
MSPTSLLAETGKVTLAWDPIDDPELAGYTIVWGQSSKAYSAAQNVGMNPEATVSLEAGKTYYMAVQGVDKQGVPGELSEEVTAIVGGPDTVPPVISGVSVVNITSSSAVVSFSTNEEAYVQVEYGKSALLGSWTGFTTVSSKNHAVTLTNLTAGTTHSYRMIAKDLTGNQILSEILTFRTKDGTDDSTNPNAPIKFLQITLSNVGNTSVTVNWTTDKSTTGFIEYGPGYTYSFNGFDASSTANHAVQLNNLTPSTLYRYKLTAIDASNNRVTSGVLMFKTSDRLSELARPSSEAIFIPSIIENGRFRTNLGINNLSKSQANVSLTLVDAEGMVLGGKTVQVEADGLEQINSVARFLFENSVGSDIEGNLYLESDRPISAWASQIDNITNDPSLLLSKRSGTTRVLIPSSANMGTFSSSLVLMNVGISTAQVVLKAYGTSGELLGQSSAPMLIAPNGVMSFENVLQSLGVTDNYGPIEIVSLNNVPVIASSRVSSATQSGGFFEGLKYSEASLSQIVAHVVDNYEIRTNLGINNMTDFPATVSIRLFDRDGIERASTSVSVAPRGLTQVNNVVRQLLNLQDVANLEGYIRLQSDQPIFGWASQIDNVTNDPGFAVSKGQGASHLLVQSTANVGSFKSSLIVVNTGSAQALVDLISRDAEGNIKGQSRGVVIPVGGFFSTANILELLGVTSGYGPIEIISTNGQPVMATSRVYSTSGTSGFFEGQVID